MAAIQFQGRDGELRLYDGNSPPSYVSVKFENMDFQGPIAKPRPPDPVVPTITGYVHAPQDDSYERAFYEPVSISFSCQLDDTSNTYKLQDAMCNPYLNTPWAVGGVNWITTKGRGSIILSDGLFSPTQQFYDQRKVTIDAELLWSNPQAGSSWGLRYGEVYFPPQDQSYQETPDAVTLAAKGLVYGNISRIGAFTAGNPS